MPVWHSSAASKHVPPAGTGSPMQLPFTELHTPFWQPTVRAEQSFGAPPTHWPASHVRFTMQRSPVSAHGCPFFPASGVGSQTPVAGLQKTMLHSMYGEKE